MAENLMAQRIKKIGFYTEGPPFDGSTIEQRSLGGSETALIQAARALAARGHQVLVFNSCLQAGIFDEVEYLPARTFPRYSQAGFDVFIVSRFHGFFNVPFQSGLKVLWNHDTLERPRELRSVIGQIDLMFVLSAFHRNNYLTRLPQMDQRTFVTRNGLDLGLIDQVITGRQKDQRKVIYASRPERGLKVLLEDIWPRLKRARPDLTLYLCGYQVNQRDIAPGLIELYGFLDTMIQQIPGVVNLGPLRKEDYYRHLAESAMMLYPCLFPEISCIAALEAQACRTPIVTTDDFALSETVTIPEFKIPGRPGRPDYDQAFVRKVLDLLDAPHEAAGLADLARTNIEKRYTWPRIVAEWDRLFDLALAARQAREDGERGQTPFLQQ